MLRTGDTEPVRPGLALGVRVLGLGFPWGLGFRVLRFLGGLGSRFGGLRI